MALEVGTVLICKDFGTECMVGNIWYDYYAPNLHGYQIVSTGNDEQDYYPGWMVEDQVLEYYAFKDKIKQVLYGR